MSNLSVLKDAIRDAKSELFEAEQNLRDCTKLDEVRAMCEVQQAQIAVERLTSQYNIAKTTGNS